MHQTPMCILYRVCGTFLFVSKIIYYMTLKKVQNFTINYITFLFHCQYLFSITMAYFTLKSPISIKGRSSLSVIYHIFVNLSRIKLRIYQEIHKRRSDFEESRKGFQCGVINYIGKGKKLD